MSVSVHIESDMLHHQLNLTCESKRVGRICQLNTDYNLSFWRQVFADPITSVMLWKIQVNQQSGYSTGTNNL